MESEHVHRTTEERGRGEVTVPLRRRPGVVAQKVALLTLNRFGRCSDAPARDDAEVNQDPPATDGLFSLRRFDSYATLTPSWALRPTLVYTNSSLEGNSHTCTPSRLP